MGMAAQWNKRQRLYLFLVLAAATSTTTLVIWGIRYRIPQRIRRHVEQLRLSLLNLQAASSSSSDILRQLADDIQEYLQAPVQQPLPQSLQRLAALLTEPSVQTSIENSAGSIVRGVFNELQYQAGPQGGLGVNGIVENIVQRFGHALTTQQGQQMILNIVRTATETATSVGMDTAQRALQVYILPDIGNARGPPAPIAVLAQRAATWAGSPNGRGIMLSVTRQVATSVVRAIVQQTQNTNVVLATVQVLQQPQVKVLLRDVVATCSREVVQTAVRSVVSGTYSDSTSTVESGSDQEENGQIIDATGYDNTSHRAGITHFAGDRLQGSASPAASMPVELPLPPATLEQVDVRNATVGLQNCPPNVVHHVEPLDDAVDGNSESSGTAGPSSLSLQQAASQPTDSELPIPQPHTPTQRVDRADTSLIRARGDSSQAREAPPLATASLPAYRAHQNESTPDAVGVFHGILLTQRDQSSTPAQQSYHLSTSPSPPATFASGSTDVEYDADTDSGRMPHQRLQDRSPLSERHRQPHTLLLVPHSGPVTSSGPDTPDRRREDARTLSSAESADGSIEDISVSRLPALPNKRSRQYASLSRTSGRQVVAALATMLTVPEARALLRDVAAVATRESAAVMWEGVRTAAHVQTTSAARAASKLRVQAYLGVVVLSVLIAVIAVRYAPFGDVSNVSV